MERNRAMAKGRGVAKLPPKWENGSAGNKSPRTPLSFHSQPENSLHEGKKTTKKTQLHRMDFGILSHSFDQPHLHRTTRPTAAASNELYLRLIQ